MIIKKLIPDSERTEQTVSPPSQPSSIGRSKGKGKRPPKKAKAEATEEVKLRVLQESETLNDKNEKFENTTIIYQKGDDKYHAQIAEQIESADSLDLQKLDGTLIPPTHFQPPCDPSFLHATDAAQRDGFVKTPSLLNYPDPGTDDLVLDEVKMYEALKKFPHPNIVKYHGVVVSDDKRIAGICIEKLALDLHERVNAKDRPPLDREACLKGIEAGIRHLHHHGFVHCDINPNNVMFREDDDTPVIMDFDSCKVEGEELGLKTGTPGFTDGRFTQAKDQLDFVGLTKIRKWLEGQTRKTERRSRKRRHRKAKAS